MTQNEIKLKFLGRILDDERTVEEFEMYEASVVDIIGKLRGDMQIFARTMDGKSVDIYVSSNDKISDVKIKIRDKTGLHPDGQKLIFLAGILQDNKTVEEYRIADKAYINVVARLRGGMQIFAEMDGKILTFEVTKHEKISDIKKKIQEKIGLNPDEQKLVFQGGILEDDRTVDEYQIAEKSVINVLARLRIDMQIFAKTIDGKTVAFDVSKHEKILNIKRKIQERIGLHPDEQNLVFQGGILEDNKTVGECGIMEKSVINVIVILRGYMQIYARTMDGKTVALEVSKHDKISDINRKIQENTGLHPNKQKLLFQNQILLEDTTVEQCGIVDQAVIDIVIRIGSNWMQIYAKTTEGRTAAFDVNRLDKVGEVKIKIQSKLGLLPNKTKLQFRNRILEDDETLEYYEIADKSVIYIATR